MGAACCGGSKHASKQAAEQNGERFVERRHETRGHASHFSAVPFDVIVPDRNASLSPGASGQFPLPAAASSSPIEQSVSFAAFDQTMYSMRADTSLSSDQQQPSGTFNLDTNMSFTNNFTDVTKEVVKNFLNNVHTIAENGEQTTNMLEESILMHRPTTPSSGPQLVGAGSHRMTAEDEAYVHDGNTLVEKVSRLVEVEEALRQGIYGSWRMNSTLIQLAVVGVVPTLRQRRQKWNIQSSEAAAPAGPGGGEKRVAHKKPVVIVHAVGMELDRSSLAVTPSEETLFSPAHMSDSPATKTSPPSGQGMDALNRSLSRSGISPSAATVEHYEMLALTCRHIDPTDKVSAKVVSNTWDFLSHDDNTNALNRGECLFRFMCGPVPGFDKETLDVMHLFINQSSFVDEEKENNTPKIDVYDPEDAAKYICISVKAMYMLPGVKLANITKAEVSSQAYQKACQPSQNKLEDCEMDDTFRITIGIIRFVFSLTVMFRVSEITDPAVLFSFKSADGMVPAKAIMLERTKRNVSKVDATAKVRSVLLYYAVNDGVLVNSHTFVLNTSIPKMAAKIVNTFGNQGAAQSAETAQLTRKYLTKQFGDSRKK